MAGTIRRGHRVSVAIPALTAPLEPWQRLVGHAGYIAEGSLYFVVGCFALLAAFGREHPNGSKGALAKLGGSAFGDILLVLLLVGGYLLNAAWRHDPRYSGGVAGALDGLKQRPGGEWLLGALAAGLMCYGLYEVAEERYRRLRDS